MLSKSLIQFSVDGWSCVLSLLFDLRPNYSGGNEDNEDLLQQALLHSVPPTLQQATSIPRLHWRLLDTHGQVWLSLLWGHCCFLPGPGAHKVLFLPSKSLFSHSCVGCVGSTHRTHTEVAQSCPTFCDPMDYSLLGSSSPWDFPCMNTGVGCRFLMVGLMATFAKRTYAIPRSTAPRAPAHAAVHC